MDCCLIVSIDCVSQLRVASHNDIGDRDVGLAIVIDDQVVASNDDVDSVSVTEVVSQFVAVASDFNAWRFAWWCTDLNQNALGSAWVAWIVAWVRCFNDHRLGTGSNLAFLTVADVREQGNWGSRVDGSRVNC